MLCKFAGTTPLALNLKVSENSANTSRNFFLYKIGKNIEKYQELSFGHGIKL